MTDFDCNATYIKLMPKILRHRNQAREHSKQLRTQDSVLEWSGLTAIIAATVLAFVAAIVDDPNKIGQWAYVCGVVGGLNMVGGICEMVAQRRQYDYRLEEAKHCEGKLNSILIALEAQTIHWSDVIEEYRTVVEQYPTILKEDRSAKGSSGLRRLRTARAFLSRLIYKAMR